MMQLISMQENPVVLKKNLDARELLDNVCAAMEPAAKEKDIAFTMDVQIDTLTGDTDLLFSLFTNLTDNAIKASPEHAVIRLTASREENQQSLSVIDRGGGIPADQIALVTEPFYRVDKARSRKLGGAGLGLSLCQMIAQAHGGRLDIQSEAGKGTAISMIWPAEEKKDE